MNIKSAINVRGIVIPETTVVYAGQVDAIMRRLVDINPKGTQVYCSFPAEKAAGEVAKRLGQNEAISIKLPNTPNDHVDFLAGYFEPAAEKFSNIVIIGVSDLVCDALKAFTPTTSGAMKDILTVDFVPGWCFELARYPQDKKRRVDFKKVGYFNYPADQESAAA